MNITSARKLPPQCFPRCCLARKWVKSMSNSFARPTSVERRGAVWELFKVALRRPILLATYPTHGRCAINIPSIDHYITRYITTTMKTNAGANLMSSNPPANINRRP